jgi:hypothetical protein
MDPKQNFIQGLIGKAKQYLNPTISVDNPINHQPVTAPAPKIDVQKYLAAIANNETGIVKGNPYTFAKFSGDPKMGRDLGKYQVTEGELKSYAPKYLGQKMTGDQFLASSTAQDRYITNKANRFAGEGYTPPQVADIHRRGFTNASPPGSTQYQDPAYVAKFNNNYKSP